MLAAEFEGKSPDAFEGKLQTSLTGCWTCVTPERPPMVKRKTEKGKKDEEKGKQVFSRPDLTS